MTLSLGLLILRLVLGLWLMGHGAQKLFGWFGGPGFVGLQGMLKGQGFRPALFWALLAGAGEFGGGLLLAAGLFSSLGAVAIIGAMLMAVFKMHWKKGFWGTKGGYEYPLMLALVAFVLGFLGAGAYSLDALLGLTAVSTFLFWPALLLAVIVVIVGIVLSNQQAVVEHQPAA